jgi:hypothetical protein
MTLNRVTLGSRTRLHAERPKTRTEIKSETKTGESTVPALLTTPMIPSRQRSLPPPNPPLRIFYQDTVLLGLEPTPILAIVDLFR